MGIPTTFEFTVSNWTPTVNELVTFKVKLMAGTVGLSKPVYVFHRQPDGDVINDPPIITIDGEATFTVSWDHYETWIYTAGF